MLALLLSAAGLFAGKPKPDLKITKIELTRDCRLAITVRNNGPGKLPDEVYTNHHRKSAGVYIDISSSYGLSFQEQTIWRFDTARKLQPKGGKVTFIFPQIISTRVSIHAKVDRYDVVEEANENNNKRQREFSECSPGPSVVRSSGISAVGPKNSITNIRFKPGSPSQLFPMQKVWVYFDYFTNEKQGVYIGVKAMYRGASLGGIGQIQLLKPGGKGKEQSYFTFGKGPVTVDAVQFRMSTAVKGKTIYEKTVKVKFDFKAMHISAKPPKRVFLDFNGARLVYVPSSKKIRIRAGNIVLSTGKDWESIKVLPHIYHLRQENWPDFFWMVDTNSKYAARVTNGTFGQIVGQNIIIPGISVRVTGGAGTGPPQRFVLRFSKAFLEYTPTPGAVRVITENSVLSWRTDWRDCNMSANTFHIKQKAWEGFFWKINTSEKKAYKVTGGSFCTSGGSTSRVPVGVRVYK
jgi:hypothetical protein